MSLLKDTFLDIVQRMLFQSSSQPFKTAMRDVYLSVSFFAGSET